ncbi:ABC transporter permease [Streptomyces albidoflavus]
MTVSVAAVLHSEWLKIRSVRASYGSLLAVLGVTLALTLLVHAVVGGPDDGTDPVYGAFQAVNYAQVAALAFGATAVSSEYAHGALRVSLAAVPRRGLLYGSKVAVVAGAGLVVGTVTGFATFLVGQGFAGAEDRLGLGDTGVLRACLGTGVYLMLMALLAAGLTFLLRSAVAVLSVLVPFILIASFVFGAGTDDDGGFAAYLPDRAGQQVLHQVPGGPLGAWGGVGVLALWAGSALLAGCVALRRRDA